MKTGTSWIKSNLQRVIQNYRQLKKLWSRLHVVSNVLADGLALFGMGPSAGEFDSDVLNVNGCISDIWPTGYVTMVAITGTTILGPYLLGQVTATYLDLAPVDVLTAIHLNIGHPWMKSTGARSSNELQRLESKIGHQDSSSSNGCQGDMPEWDLTDYMTWIVALAISLIYSYIYILFI